MSRLDPDKLLEAHRLYDQYVDVVSAFEWLYTATNEMPETVKYFDRFPRLKTDDEIPATPDFTVLFNDGTGLVAEIARISLQEESVDQLCRQIGRYDSLTRLKDADGTSVPVSHVDVLLLVPFEIGTDVVRRVIKDRLNNPEHEYNPQRAPCVVQYVAQSDKYVFQRRAEIENGKLDDASRDPGLGHWLDQGDFKPPANGFSYVKAQHPFMNDPVAPLYLACQLWTKLFPTLTVDVSRIGDYTSIVLAIDTLVQEIRDRYGPVDRGALRRAMEILVASHCAEELESDRWRVAWGDLGQRQGDEIGEVLARRADKPPAKGPIKRLIDAYADQGIEDPERRPLPIPGTLF